MKDSMSREAKDSAADRRRGPRTSMVTSQPRADIHVAASALLPSKAPARRGNPVSSVSSPTVICGSRRLSLEKPGSRKPSALSVPVVQGHTRRTGPARPGRCGRTRPAGVTGSG